MVSNIKSDYSLIQTAQKLTDFYKRLKSEQHDRAQRHLKKQLVEKIKQIERSVKELPEGTHYLSDITHTTSQFKELLARLEEKPTLFIMGEGNVGKSTVINALLGKPIAKMKFEPMTWKIDVYRKQDQKGIYALTKNQKVIHYPDKQAAICFFEAEESKRTDSIDAIHHLIQEKTNLVWKAAKEVPYSIIKEKLDSYKEKVWKQHLYQSDIVEAHWPISDNTLLENFKLVDTPGLEQNRFSDYLEETMIHYFDEADVIIWVLDMNKLASETTQTYQKDIQKKRAIALLNRCDLVHTEEETSAVLNQAKYLYGDTFKSIIPFSATLALKGHLKKDQDLLDKSHYHQLVDEIHHHFLADIKRIKNQNIREAAQHEQDSLQGVIAYALEKLNTQTKLHLADLEEIKQIYETLTSESLKTFEDILLNEKQQLKDSVAQFIDSLLRKESFILYDEVQVFLIDYIHQNDIILFLTKLIDTLAKLRQEHAPKKYAIKESLLRELIDHFNFKSYFNQIADELEDNHLFQKFVRKIMIKRYLLEVGEKLNQSIKKALDKLEVDLKEQVKLGIWQELMGVLEQKQLQFDTLYGNDKRRIDQNYAFKMIQSIIENPIKEATLIDFIKGE